MINIKHLLTFIMAIILMLAFVGCEKNNSKNETETQTTNSLAETKKPAEDWLPFGLQFGMTYDEFSQMLTDQDITVPELTHDDSINGWSTKSISNCPWEKDSLYNSIFPVEVLPDNPTEEDIALHNLLMSTHKSFYRALFTNIFFHFNQNKELYRLEYYLDIPKDAPFFQEKFDEITEYYKKKCKLDKMENVYTDSFGTIWKSEKLTLACQYNTDIEHIVIIIHNSNYDLDN